MVLPSPRVTGRADAGKEYLIGLSLALVTAAIAIGVSSCARKALPETGSPAEELYAKRCGGCHRPYLPSSMTSTMWGMQVDAMQLKLAEASMPPLSDAERGEILDYLQRNAGTH
jgi:hypothetical protein